VAERDANPAIRVALSTARTNPDFVLLPPERRLPLRWLIGCVLLLFPLHSRNAAQLPCERRGASLL